MTHPRNPAALVGVAAMICLITACGEFIQSMEGLWDLQQNLTSRYGLKDVHVHLHNDDVLTVTIADPAKLYMPAEQQVMWALDFARYTYTTYGRSANKNGRKNGLETLVVQFATDSDAEDVQSSYRFATAQFAIESVATESVATERAATERAATESVATERAATETAASESSAAEP